jgi:signal transduction histidine kinase
VESDPDVEGGKVVVIHVADTGPGIPARALAEMFKPYFTTKSGGSGLGLPTSRRLIEEHGGRITVESEEGKGADFAVVLPLG